tara:strand:- start:5513 stop:5713 length:201 start_codon:yes stop_codon:yes gene_type:complete
LFNCSGYTVVIALSNKVLAMGSADKLTAGNKACCCSTAAAVNSCRYYWAGDCEKSSNKSLETKSDE